MKTTIVEKATGLRSGMQSLSGLFGRAKRTAAAKPLATERAIAALERQLAEFQQTFSVRWEW